MASKFAVIRVDASKQVGGGHIMRSLTLGRALMKKGWQCSLAFREGTVETIPTVLSSGMGLFEFKGPDNRESLEMKERWPDGCDLLVVDHYLRDVVFEEMCRGWAGKILVIDDLADRPHDCDILLDQTYGRKEEAYDGLVSADCRLLMGAEYALLNPRFSELRQSALERREKIGPVSNILISFGMMDNKNGCCMGLLALKRIGFEGKVFVMIGSSAPHLADLKKTALEMPFPVSWHVDEGDPAQIMVDADLALGACGSTVWERCCMGLPSLVMVTADNQRRIAQNLNAAGAVILLSEVEAEQVPAMVEVFRRIIENPVSCMEISRKASRLCDGLGIMRVIEVLS